MKHNQIFRPFIQDLTTFSQ